MLLDVVIKGVRLHELFQIQSAASFEKVLRSANLKMYLTNSKGESDRGSRRYSSFNPAIPVFLGTYLFELMCSTDVPVEDIFDVVLKTETGRGTAGVFNLMQLNKIDLNLLIGALSKPRNAKEKIALRIVPALQDLYSRNLTFRLPSPIGKIKRKEKAPKPKKVSINSKFGRGRMLRSKKVDSYLGSSHSIRLEEILSNVGAPVETRRRALNLLRSDASEDEIHDFIEDFDHFSYGERTGTYIISVPQNTNTSTNFWSATPPVDIPNIDEGRAPERLPDW